MSFFYQDQLSTKLARKPELNEVTELQAILTRPRPEHWAAHLDDQWELTRRANFQTAIARLWGANELIQNLGWVEHTSDWDWWVRLTYKRGAPPHREEFDCGSYLTGMKAANGTIYKTFKDLAGEWSHSSNQELSHLIVDGQWYEDDEDPESLVEAIIEIPIWDIDSIHLGYDT